MSWDPACTSLDGMHAYMFVAAVLTCRIPRSSGLDVRAARRNKEEKFLKMKEDYAREGMRRAIHAVVLVNSHGPSRGCTTIAPIVICCIAPLSSIPASRVQSGPARFAVCAPS